MRTTIALQCTPIIQLPQITVFASIQYLQFKLIFLKVFMNQAEIDDLLRDSMFSESEARNSQINQSTSAKQIKGPQGDEYGEEQFQSYDESRRTFSKNASKNEFQESRKQPKQKNKLEQIKEQPVNPADKKQSKASKSIEKVKAKTGIYFYPPKQSNPSSSAQKKPLPFNYLRLQERQKQLLFTTITEENLQLKENLRTKDNEFKKLENTYKVLLQDYAKIAPSVRENTLQKQLSALQTKYDKLQHLCKLQKQKNSFKSSKASRTFVPEEQASQRQQQLLQIIEKLKERLLSTNNELKTLNLKMNEGENYVDQLKRKLKRIQQLQLKMDKMVEQAENDRQFIDILKDKNKKLEDQLHELQKQKKRMQVSIRRLQLSSATQTDVVKELQEVRRQKDMLQQSLKQLSSNLMQRVKSNFNNTNNIQDSGQLLRS